MSTTERPTRAAKSAALVDKPWLLEAGGAQQAANAQQPPKQARITDTFPVRKGPAPGRKAPQQKPVAATQLTAVATATERTKARAARTAAATQSGAAASSRNRKRRTPSRAASDDEEEGGVTDDEDMDDADDEQEAPSRSAKAATTTTTTTTNLRRSGRTKSATAPAPSTGRAATTGAGKSATAAAAGAGKAAAGARRRGGATAAAASRFLSNWEIDGEEYRTGDDVYVVETDDVDQLPEESEDEECSVCCRNTDPARMIECDRCLRGFHFRCLKPALKKLPEGDWLCPDCEKGVPPSFEGRRLNTCCQAFLFGDKILGLARVCGWTKDRHGEVQVLVRHYMKPEGTHLGRQKHHHSREVFLGVAEHLEPVGCIWGRAQVVPPSRFGETDGTDVYICEYEYDDKWKRFRRRLGSDEEGQADAASDDDAEWGAAAAVAALPKAAAATGGRNGGGRKGRGAASSSDGGSSEGEESERDVEFKPRNTLDGWVIRKSRPGQLTAAQARTRSGGRAHSYKAIIDEHGSGLLLDQGATVLPERGPVGPLAAARRALALNNRSGGLPCREQEKQSLRRFIGQAVEEGGDSPGVLYICGVPGTGKTACVMEVLGGVRNAAQSSGVQLVILNALQLPSPQHVYSKLWERMSGQRWGPARALKALEEVFSGGGSVGGGSGRRHLTLLIVDEIDVLITKDQAVLYNLFEWPLREGSRLAVVGISNTHDLDSRVLPRIASRLSGSKLAFNPYNFEQLKEILNARLQGVTAVAKGAVEFCARKVASTTGDVRRALELLRRATEIAEAELATAAPQQQQSQSQAAADLTNVVGARQATAAIKEMYGSVHMTLLRRAGLFQKLLLVALLVEVRAQNKPEVTVAALHHRLSSHLALMLPAANLPLSRVVEAAAALGAQRLVVADAGWQGPGMKLTLNVPQDDVVALLREDPALAAVRSCLA